MGKTNTELNLIINITKQGKGLAETSEGLKQLRRESNRLQRAYEILGMKSFKEVRREALLLRAAMERLKDAYKNGKISSLEFYRAQVKLREKVAELKGELNGFAGSLGRIRTGLVAIAGAGYALVKSFGAYKEFTQRMAEVNTLVNVSAGQFNKLRDSILKLSTEVPQSASSLALG